MKIGFHIDLAMSTFLSHKVAKTTDEVAKTSAKRGKIAFLHDKRLNQNKLFFLNLDLRYPLSSLKCVRVTETITLETPLMQGLPCGTTGIVRAVLHNTDARGQFNKTLTSVMYKCAHCFGV